MDQLMNVFVVSLKFLEIEFRFFCFSNLKSTFLLQINVSPSNHLRLFSSASSSSSWFLLILKFILKFKSNFEISHTWIDLRINVNGYFKSLKYFSKPKKANLKRKSFQNKHFKSTSKSSSSSSLIHSPFLTATFNHVI